MLGHTEQTPVLFRKWKKEPLKGQVVAVFPTLPADRQGFELTTYEHVGQHGGADRHAIINLTERVKGDEYLPLHRELIDQGYSNLKIARRITPAMDIKRMKDARK